jgi:type IV pilus secretin PilQ/predicted competence protein
MRIKRALGLGALVASGCYLLGGPLNAAEAPVVHLNAVVNDGKVQLQASADGPFEYTSYRQSPTLYVVDLSGVSAGDAAGARVVASDLVKSYRVISYSSAKKPMVRVELLVAKNVEPRIERTDAKDISLIVSSDSVASSPSASAPLAASVPPVATKPARELVDVAARPAIQSAHPSIQNVKLSDNAGTTQVDISGSGTLAYSSTRLQNPDRLVIDFNGAQLRTSERHIASNLDPVREIRLAQFNPETSRVVIDLRAKTHYSIAGNGNLVTVTFVSEPANSQAAATNLPSPKVTTIKAADSAPIQARKVQPVAKAGVIPAPASTLPVALTGSSASLAVPAGQAPVQPTVISAVATKVSAAAPAIPAATVPTPVLSASNTEPIAVPAPPRPQPQAAPGNAKFSGEPISVNLKDVDLRDFFRLIHEISGLNVVVDPSVKGNLTIVLDDVPWDQALDIVLKNNDLDKQLDGNVLRVATKDTLRKEAEENRDLAKAQAEAADVVTTTRVLSYAKATSLAVTLKKFLSSRGDIIADDRSNTLIIRDIPTTLPVLDNLIRQLDRKSQQVEIEARVVAANRSFSREIGTQFGLAGATPSGNNIIGGSSEVGTSPVIRNFPPLPAPPIVIGSGGASATSGSIPLASNLGASVPTSGLSYSFSSKNLALDLIITAAEDRGVGKLLSKPKVITQNNEKATVKQGTKIPVQTIVNNTVSVQFVDAVLELDVTPQITAEGTVYMDVTVENDAIDASIPRVEGIPAIDTQSAETKVTVNDGATVVIGGIIVTNQRTDIQQVPLVGSVPLLGNLFKHTTVSSTSQELLFFLTPRILPG